MHKFCSALEYAGRINLFCLPGQQPFITTAIINNEGIFWIWKNYFTQETVVWYFERDKVSRQLKRVQTQLKKMTTDNPELTFVLGDTIQEVVAYKYSSLKLLWIDYLNKCMALKLLEIKKLEWKTTADDLTEIEYLLTEGAHIYKEDRSGHRLIDTILNQPNAKLCALVCKIADYPLEKYDENTVTLLRDMEYKTFREPCRMSLREAQERDFLIEID